jgi:altronate hydrolase
VTGRVAFHGRDARGTLGVEPGAGAHTMTIELIRIRPEDNVAVAIREFSQGTELGLADGLSVVATEDVPYGNKVALRAIAAGEPIVKYGEPIGHASRDIVPGEVVHTHNVTPLEMPDAYIETT